MGDNIKLKEFVGRFSSPMARNQLIDMIEACLKKEKQEPHKDLKDVLDLQIRKIMNGGLDRPYAIVNGEINRDSLPIVKGRGKQKTLFIEYLGLDWNLGEYSIDVLSDIVEKGKLNLNINIYGYRDLIFKFILKGSNRRVEKGVAFRSTDGLPLDDWLLGLHQIHAKTYETCTGVGVKQLGKDGRLQFSGEWYYLGKPKSHVFVYFDEGSVYFFNIDGELIPKTVIGTNRRTILKIQKLHEIFQDYDVADSEENASQYMLNEWIRDDKQFSGQGLELLLEGQDNNRVQSGGYVTLRCYEKTEQGKKQREKVHLGKRFYDAESEGNNVVLKWKGPYVLVVDKDNPETVLNAEKLGHDFGIETHGQRIFDRIGNMFYLRNIESGGFKQATINGITYLFKKSDLDKIKGYNPNATHALFAHIKDNNAVFQVLEKSGQDIIKYDIEPYKVLTNK